MKKLKFNFKINLIKLYAIKKLDNNSINIIDIDFKFKNIFDKISKNSNKFIEKSFVTALYLMKQNKGYALINGPISKKYFLKNKHLGVTEYLAKKTGSTNNEVMLIYNKKLAVSPITTHLPLKFVHKNLSKKKIINHVKTIAKFYKNTLSIKPRFGITGLNPHCESNYNSSEEDRIIKPAINFLVKRKYNIKGPFAADTIFMKEQIKKYDVIIGMYHDQVLTPVKTIFGFNAINITLGLPFIRISPDHGPNEKMVGKNLSTPKSLIEALKFLNKK